MRKFVLQNQHTSIIAVTPSHRYDIWDFFCVNKETVVFTRKLHKQLKDMHHVSVVDINLTRDKFTRHGLHLNSSCKERIAKIIGQNMTKIVSLSKNDGGVNINVARSSCRLKRPPVTRSEDFYG